jgi:hypothetical protein
LPGNKSNSQLASIEPLTIEDYDSSCGDTIGKHEIEDETQYDFVYNLPPFLRGFEGLPRIWVALKGNDAIEKFLNKNH